MSKTARGPIVKDRIITMRFGQWIIVMTGEFTGYPIESEDHLEDDAPQLISSKTSTWKHVASCRSTSLPGFILLSSRVMSRCALCSGTDRRRSRFCAFDENERLFELGSTLKMGSMAA